MLVVLISHAIMKWSKRPGKGDQEKTSVHILRPSQAVPFARMLGVSWRWQVNINLRQGSLLGLPSVIPGFKHPEMRSQVGFMKHDYEQS